MKERYAVVNAVGTTDSEYNSMRLRRLIFAGVKNLAIALQICPSALSIDEFYLHSSMWPPNSCLSCVAGNITMLADVVRY